MICDVILSRLQVHVTCTHGGVAYVGCWAIRMRIRRSSLVSWRVYWAETLGWQCVVSPTPWPSAVSGGVKSHTYIEHCPHACKCTYPLVTGEVYSWGSGIYGQLGHGNMRDRFSPLMIGAPLRGIGITLVACHEYHSAAVAGQEEEVWLWAWFSCSVCM